MQFPWAVTFVLAVAEENCNPSPCCGLGAGAGLLPAWPRRGKAMGHQLLLQTAIFGTGAGARCAPAQGICQSLLKLPFLRRLQGDGVLAWRSARRHPAWFVPAASIRAVLQQERGQNGRCWHLYHLYGPACQWSLIFPGCMGFWKIPHHYNSLGKSAATQLHALGHSSRRRLPLSSGSQGEIHPGSTRSPAPGCPL